MAVKATYIKVNGKGIPIYKDPKTGDGFKKSAKGLLMVTRTGGRYSLIDNVSTDQERYGCLRTIFKNGKLIHETTLSEIRDIVKNELIYLQ